MRKTLLTIVLTFVVTVCLGLLALWQWTDVFDEQEPHRIKLAGGTIVVSEEGSLLHVRSGANRIMLGYTVDEFAFSVFEDGEDFPLVALSGGRAEEDCFVLYSYRTAEGRWEAVRQNGWRGMPANAVLLPDHEKGLPAEVSTFEIIRTEKIVNRVADRDDPTHDHAADVSPSEPSTEKAE